MAILYLTGIDYQMALYINDRKFQEAAYYLHLSLIRQYSSLSSKKNILCGVSNRGNISYDIFS